MIPDHETFKEIYDEADAAGKLAVENLHVIPMIVGQETYFGSGQMKPETMEYVADGVCGFAWVECYPVFRSNSNLGKQERRVLKEFGFDKDWDSNKKYTLWISDYNQSLQKKEAYARAFAKVLGDHGIKAYCRSRID